MHSIVAGIIAFIFFVGAIALALLGVIAWWIAVAVVLTPFVLIALFIMLVAVILSHVFSHGDTLDLDDSEFGGDPKAPTP